MAWLADISATVLLFSLLMYLMLDGTDLGVGMLCLFFKEEEQKRPMVQSILPIWDANETWLVLLAGGLFALFPAAYALLFSTLYVPFFLMLFSLILRAVALEYRETVTGPVRRWLDKLLPLSSVLAAFCQGASAGVVVSGDMSRGAFTWLNLYPVLCGLGLISVYLLLGCCWIRWRVGERVEKKASRLGGLFMVLSLVLFVVIQIGEPAPWRHAWPLSLGMMLIVLITLLWLLLIGMLLRAPPLIALIVALILMSAVVLMLWVGIYPALIPGVMELHDVASDPTSQLFVLSGMVLVIPITLAYHSWAFWVFRGRVK